MLDPKKVAEFDQNQSQILETMPPLWAGLFRNLTDIERLTPTVALSMVNTFIHAMVTRPADPEKST